MATYAFEGADLNNLISTIEISKLISWLALPISVSPILVPDFGSIKTTASDKVGVKPEKSVKRKQKQNIHTI